MKVKNLNAESQRRKVFIDKFSYKQNLSKLIFFTLCLCGLAVNSFSQSETPPVPTAPRAAKIPSVIETTLPNGLRVVVVERKNVPLISAILLVKSGANVEGDKAGLANMTASLLEKGTKTRTATQIAEQMEFLGANLNTGAGWNSSSVSVNVTSDKINQAMAIMSDAILNPTFSQAEIDLLKSQTLDELNVALKQPSTLANFVASRYTFGEHLASGTPESLAKLTRTDILGFQRENYLPANSVLIFTGDITQIQAKQLTSKYFGVWKSPIKVKGIRVNGFEESSSKNIIARLLVIDLPNSGQAAVNYAKKLNSGRLGNQYFSSSVANAILGGGYSARLNYEIRIKRGLSYGAGSSFAWRYGESNFSTRAQTKTVSAAQVAELTLAELDKLGSEVAPNDELTARKLALTGDFGRDLASNNDLLARIVELYTFDLKPAELNSYIQSVNNVSDKSVRDFAGVNLKGGDLIIVGDYKDFADDLKARFPNQKIEVIKASELDLNSNTLRKK